MTTAEHPAPHPATRREPWLVWGASIVITGLLALSPLPRAYLGAAFAAVFFLLPDLVLKRRGSAIEDYGFHTSGWRRGAAWGFAVSAIVLAGFLPGYHLWMTWAQPALYETLGVSTGPPAALDISLGAYARPDQRLWGEPAQLDDGPIHLYHLHGRNYLAWHTNGPWSLKIESDGELLPNARLAGATEGAWRHEGPTARPVYLSFATRGAQQFTVSATLDGVPVPLSDFRLGAAANAASADDGSPASEDPSAEASGVRIRLSALWVLNMVLVHLLLVALPEELFFRGYLQRAFDETRGRARWFAIGPLVFTRSIVITSLLFALGHLLVEPGLGRLAVFFPSLLFGALRDKTDGIIAPVLVHAACNVMVQLTAVHYW